MAWDGVRYDRPCQSCRPYLLYFILPLWLLAGLSDYVLHKRTHIEDNSGTKESVLHALQLGEAGIPVILGLLFDINALIIAIMLVALVVHEATALWDVTYAHTRRYISPLEQHVHSFLEVLPIMAVSFVTVLYWDQLQALLAWDLSLHVLNFVPKPILFLLPICSRSSVPLRSSSVSPTVRSCGAVLKLGVAVNSPFPLARQHLDSGIERYSH